MTFHDWIADGMSGCGDGAACSISGRVFEREAERVFSWDRPLLFLPLLLGADPIVKVSSREGSPPYSSAPGSDTISCDKYGWRRAAESPPSR